GWPKTSASSWAPWKRANWLPMGRRSGPDPGRIRSALAKLLALGPGGWWRLAEAQWALAGAAATVRRAPRGRIVETLTAGSEGAGQARPEDGARVEEIALAVDRVARLGLGRPLCLVRSLALHRLLVREGVPGSRIRFGVRMESSVFEAHAWVEWNGEVVGEPAEWVRRFQPFSEVPAGPAPAWTRGSPSP